MNYTISCEKRKNIWTFIPPIQLWKKEKCTYCEIDKLQTLFFYTIGNKWEYTLHMPTSMTVIQDILRMIILESDMDNMFQMRGN